MACFSRWEQELPIDTSERRLNQKLYQRFRICGVDPGAQTVEIYFMDHFLDLESAQKEVEFQPESKSLGRNLAVQTRTFTELLAHATFLTHHDDLHNKGLQGVNVRRADPASVGFELGTGLLTNKRPNETVKILGFLQSVSDH